MNIEKANREDAKNLTELTIRSKAHWGYGPEQIEAWKDELTITGNYIEENEVFKLSIKDKLIGFYAYRPENKICIKLNFLFIEPQLIGKGYGKTLMFDFLKRLKNSTFESTVLDADPNAEQFYSKLGFKVIGKRGSLIKNRFLPIMELKIKQFKTL